MSLGIGERQLAASPGQVAVRDFLPTALYKWAHSIGRAADCVHQSLAQLLGLQLAVQVAGGEDYNPFCWKDPRIAKYEQELDEGALPDGGWSPPAGTDDGSGDVRVTFQVPHWVEPDVATLHCRTGSGRRTTRAGLRSCLQPCKHALPMRIGFCDRGDCPRANGLKRAFNRRLARGLAWCSALNVGTVRSSETTLSEDACVQSASSEFLGSASKGGDQLALHAVTSPRANNRQVAEITTQALSTKACGISSEPYAEVAPRTDVCLIRDGPGFAEAGSAKATLCQDWAAYKVGSLSSLAQPVPAHDPAQAVLAPALPLPGDAPSSGAKATGYPPQPSMMQQMLAQQARLIPPLLDSELANLPPREIAVLRPDYDEDSTEPRYDLFDHLHDHRTRRARRGWTVHEFAVDATRAVPFVPRYIHFLTIPLPSTFLPNVVVSPLRGGAQTWAIPVDLRSVGGRIATALVQPPGQVVDLISQLKSKGHDGRGDILRGVVSGDLGVFDCRGYRLAQLTESQDVHQWVAVRTLADVPEEVREATTRTTTWMQPERPPVLLGQVAGFTTDELPLRLHPVHLVPEGLRQAYSSRIPAAQLRLFPQLDPASAGTKPVPFSLLMRGFPPARLQGAARWSLIDFVNDAVSQCDRPPRRAQLLTTSLAGVDEPQIVVTEHADSDDPNACVVPIDLRGMQGEVIPVVLVPGMGLPEVLQAAAEHLPALPTALQVLGSEAPSEMFMQDAQGQVYEVLPQNLLHLQWLIIRPRTEAPILQPLFGPTSTTTTTACMLATGQEDPRTVQFIMVGDGTTVRLVETPYSQADPHLAVLELIRALARLGRLQTDFTVQLAPVLPRTTAATRYIVPLLYVPQQSNSEAASGTITVLYDPGVDGTQVHAMILPEGARPSEILSEVQKRSGAQIFVNGVHSNVCSRPLLTGDFIQQMGAGRFPGVARNIGPLLDDISRLRCLFFPMSLPALGLFLGPQGPLVAPRVGIQSIEERLGDAFERRLDQLGRPARTSKRITVFQPGHAPHIFWIDTPLTPTVFEACEHLEGTGLFTSGMQLVDVASNVELWGADAFIALPAEVSWVTCTINDPFAVLYYLLVHFPQGAQPPIDYLPLRPGMMFRPMPRIVNGAHIGHTRAPRAPSATGSGQAHQQSTPRAASRPSSGGTSLVQLTFPKARRRQVIFDDTPEARRAALIEATGASTRPVVIPTPCGRRRLGQQSAVPGDAKPARLCFEQFVPEPPPVVTWEVNADILDSALTGHEQANFSQALPLAIAPTAHARIWDDIPAFVHDSRVDGLFLFTDGSFFPGQTRASWAVVALALQDGQIRRFGHLSGVCTAAPAERLYGACDLSLRW